MSALAALLLLAQAASAAPLSDSPLTRVIQGTSCEEALDKAEARGLVKADSTRVIAHGTTESVQQELLDYLAKHRRNRVLYGLSGSTLLFLDVDEDKIQLTGGLAEDLKKLDAENVNVLFLVCPPPSS